MKLIKHMINRVKGEKIIVIITHDTQVISCCDEVIAL